MRSRSVQAHKKIALHESHAGECEWSTDNILFGKDMSLQIGDKCTRLFIPKGETNDTHQSQLRKKGDIRHDISLMILLGVALLFFFIQIHITNIAFDE